MRNERQSLAPFSINAQLGVGPLDRSPGQVSGSMQTGPWSIGPDGRPSYGSLGVLLDVLVGGAVSPSCPPGHWPSTTEISATFAAPLPADGTVLAAESKAILLRATGGLAEAWIRAADGQVIAVATGRFKFTPNANSDVVIPTSQATDPSPIRDPSLSALSLLELFEATVDESDDHLVVELPAGVRAANPVNNVHGGVSLSMSIVAGLLAIHAEDDPFDATSAQIAYLRPCPATSAARYRATVIHRGRTFAVVAVEGIRPDGKAISSATVTMNAAPH